MTCASLDDNSTFIIFTFRLTTYQFTFLFQIYIYHILPIHHPPAPMPALPFDGETLIATCCGAMNDDEVDFTHDCTNKVELMAVRMVTTI